MTEEEVIVGIDSLTDMELVDLYNRILEHIRFLDNSIIEIESEGNSND